MDPNWRRFVLSMLAWAGCAWAEPSIQEAAYSGGAKETIYDTQGALFPLAAAADASIHEWSASLGSTGRFSTREATPTYGDSYSLSLLSAQHDDTLAIPVERTEESLHPVKVEETLKESQTAAAVYPLRGIKSLVVGSILLALALFAFTCSEDAELDSDSYDKFYSYIGEEVLRAFDELDNHIERSLPGLPLPVTTFWVLAGAAPALILSGLVDLTLSLRRRRLGKPPSAAPPLRGVFLALLAVVIALPLVALPGNVHGHDEIQDAVVDTIGNFALGVGITGIMMMLTSLAQRYIYRRKQNGLPVDGAASRFPQLSPEDTTYWFDKFFHDAK